METPKSSDKPKEGKRSLPSTGTADHLGLLVTGLTFVATAIASMKLKKKKTSKNMKDLVKRD